MLIRKRLAGIYRCYVGLNSLAWRRYCLDHHAESFSGILLSLLKESSSQSPVKQVHAQMLLNDAPRDIHLLSKLIHLQDFDYATLVFDRIREPNEFAFNIMIRALSTSWKMHFRAIRMYNEMRSTGLIPNHFTYPFLFISCASVPAAEAGRAGHALVLKSGLSRDGHISHSLITMYSRLGEPMLARKVFDGIPERELVSWNSLISGYSKMGFAKEAVELFDEMMQEGFVPDEMTLVSVLAACGDFGDLSLGKWLEAYSKKQGMEFNSFIGSALIGMYAKCGELASARRVFDEMHTKDLVTWNTMITGYSQNGASDEAIKLFNSMKNECLAWDGVTTVVVLSACASVGAIELGRWIESYAVDRGWQNDVYIVTALIDMYAKCGSIDDAQRIFSGTSQKNKASWNAMISALAFHGKTREALCLFEQMKEANVCPNDVTFVAVLSACVHAGLVHEGRLLFESIHQTFGYDPKVEHYSCMVDLLARAGLVYEAWDIVDKMPHKPDEITLGALLGACQKRKIDEVGEKVIRLLFEAGPSNSGSFVISSKIYANSRRWNDSAKMRLLMKQKGIAKTPGCSWIEIEGKIHEFHAGDSLSDDANSIYHHLMLDIITEKHGQIPFMTREETELTLALPTFSRTFPHH